MPQSYKKKHTLHKQYNTIIIGSGLGSLTTAAILAKEGQKVLVLERHYTAGGYTHIFKRKGYEWDVGIHYVGELNRSSTLKKIFDYVSDGKLKWEDMGPVYDKIVIGEKAYDFPKGVENFKKKMTQYFPEEKNAIDSYIDLIFKSTRTNRNFFIDKALPPLISKLIGWVFRKQFYKFSDKTTYEVISSITKNENLIKVLTGQYGDYGLPPKQSSFAMHATLVRHYFNGGNFPVGGSSQVANTIIPVIENAGGTVLVSAEVDKIIIEKDKAKGVLMKDGKVFFAENIVSGTGIINTYTKLIPDEVSKKHFFKAQLKNIKPSVSHVCLYIGLKGTPNELKLPKTNYWVYPNDLDHDDSINRYVKNINAPFPVVYISFASAKDPDWSKRYPNKSTIDIITLVPYKIFEKWEKNSWMKRGQEYEALKEKIAKRLLNELYKQLPHLNGSVDYYELSTPLTTKHFTNYETGEIYGLDHSPKRFRQKFLKPRTPITNFYLTGQDIITVGISAALFSGVLTSSAVLKKNVLKNIK